MKLIHKYLILGVAAAGAFTACDNYDADDRKFDNVVYLDVSKTDEVQPATFSNNTPTVEKPIQATLAYPEGQDVAVSLTVDPSLVATYNARYGSDWKMLDAKYYELSSDNVTIHAGKTASEVVTLRLKGLMGEGEQQTGALPIDETYLLPVRISHSSMSVLKGSEAAYYVVKRSSAITVAAQLTDNWIEFPSLDKYGDNSMPWNKLRAMTYEALIYIDDFALTDIQGNPVSISTVMGEEDYALLRIGDTNFEREQLQFDGSGVGFGKFPGRDNTKVLQKGYWYHVACTYDQNTRVVRVYVNGRIQSEATEMGPAALDDKNFIHLARRALYDLWTNETDPGEEGSVQDARLRYLQRSPPVLYQLFVQRLPSAERQDRRGARLVRRPHSRTDLGEHVQRREPEGRPDAARLLEIQRRQGQYGEGLLALRQRRSGEIRPEVARRHRDSEN